MIQKEILRLEITVYNIIAVKVSKGKHDATEVKTSDIWGKPPSASKVHKEFTTGDIGKQHVYIEVVLECGVEINDKWVLDTREDVSFRIRMLDLL